MFNSLQLGRAVAALLVVMHHATLGSEYFYDEAFGGFWGFGNIGVDFFFVLSGFIIYWAHKNDEGGSYNARIYAKKRFYRLYPAFIPVSIAMLALYSVIPSLSESGRDISILSSLFLIPSAYGSPALSVSWTLMHEFLFYLVFSVSFISKRLFWLAIALWSAVILIAPLLTIEGGYFKFLFSMHNIQFTLGVVAALSWHRLIGVSGARWHFPVMSAATLMLLLAAGFDVAGDGYSKLITGLFFALVILILVTMENSGLFVSIFNSKLFLFLGASSYSIYLIHNPLLSVMNRLGGRLYKEFLVPPELIFSGAVVISVIAGAIYYKVWEKPVLIFSKKRLIRN